MRHFDDDNRQQERWRFAITMLACLVTLFPAVASAASISGRITDEGGAGLAMQVRLWSEDAKGWTIDTQMTADASGNYSFTGVPAGTYKVDARMPPGFSGNYGDRWYDVAAPNGNGWIPEDADQLVLNSADDLTGINIVMPINGGIEGTVSAGGPRNGVWVRVENVSDYRVHHNHMSKQSGGDAGLYSMRGLPPGDYRFIAWDPQGAYETEVVTGPFIINANNTDGGPTITMSPMAADPAEPNDLPAASGSLIMIDPLRQTPPAAWESTGAAVAPRGNDIDWYCWDAQVGERYLINTITPLGVDGTIRTHPWIDPIASFWSNAGSNMVSEDDDSGKGRNAFVDSGEVTQAGRYCVAVSMFGDSGWSGINHQGAGRYTLRIEMGNRRPALSATWREGEMGMDASVPTLPDAISVDEGAALRIDLVGTDPDFDPLIYGMEVTDKDGMPVSVGNLEVTASQATFLWDVGETAAAGSPYQLRATVADAEYTTELLIGVEVVGVNRAPGLPIHLSPSDGETVPTTDVEVTIENAVDPDMNNVSYEFEAYFGSFDDTPDSTATVAENPGGETTWTIVGVPENTLVSWRVRGVDDAAQPATGMWTEPWVFLVDTENDGPDKPILVKPEENAVLVERIPTLSAENTLDPEGNDVSLVFEVASDSEFQDVVITSPEVPQTDMAPTTAWTAEMQLDWGATYYARVTAVDEFGATSEPSDWHVFSLVPNAAPTAPELTTFGSNCQARVIPTPSEFTVINGSDADGQELTIQLQVFLASDDRETAEPLIDVSVPQSDGSRTTIAVDRTEFEEGVQYYVRVRTYDGAAGSDWIGCDFWAGFAGEGFDDGGSKEGCGCSVRSADSEVPGGVWVVLVLGTVLVIRRRG